MKHIHIQRDNNGNVRVYPCNDTVGVGETACIDISGVGTFNVVGVAFDIRTDTSPCVNCPLFVIDMTRGCVCDHGTVLHSISKIMEEL